MGSLATWLAHRAEAVYKAEAARDPFSDETHRALTAWHQALMEARRQAGLTAPKKR